MDRPGVNSQQNPRRELPNPVPSVAETWELQTQHLGQRVLVFDILDSTSTLAASLADDWSNAGIVVLAREQTAGRGQYGRRWHAPPGTSVLLSVLLFPPPWLRRPALLTAWAAVSVCETIQQATGLQGMIKWPNDVLIQGKKVAGILIEQGRGTVVGIGLNLNQTFDDFTQAGLPEAGSLAAFMDSRARGGCQPLEDVPDANSGPNQGIDAACSPQLECPELARLLIRCLDEEYGSLCRGESAALELRWKRRLGLLGKRVTVECHDTVHHGRLLDVSWKAVLLQKADGSTRHLLPETIRHITSETLAR